MSLSSRSQLSFHTKVGWKAVDFFDDAQVIQLCQAIERDDLEEMDQLIAAGADVNTKGEGNMTPLMWAFPDNKIERFRKLLEHGADPNVKLSTHLGVPSGFLIGDSVTIKVAKSHFSEHFSSVMKHGGDANITGGRNIPLIHAIVLARVHDAKQRAEVAIEKGADVTVVYSDDTPTSAAVIHGQQLDLALFFLQRGDRFDHYSQNGICRLAHLLVMSEDRIQSSKRRAAFGRLVKYLEDHGDDLGEARKDIERRKSWPHWNPRRIAELSRQEVKAMERRAREVKLGETQRRPTQTLMP